jgi:hypothetical protein
VFGQLQASLSACMNGVVENSPPYILGSGIAVKFFREAINIMNDFYQFER